MFRRCPIDAKWSSWPSDWSSCSGNCKRRGEPVPQKSRSRVCIPESYGGRNCSHLEDQAKTNKGLLDRDVRDCSELPICPRPAMLGSWGEWSTCTQTCHPEGQPLALVERRRSCHQEFFSSDKSLNFDVASCDDLGEVKAFKSCNVGACPGQFILNFDECVGVGVAQVVILELRAL